jgi:hypothetical protein
MSQLSYIEPLTLKTVEQQRVFEARFGGASFRLIQSTLKTGHGGKALLTPEGHQVLKQLVSLWHRHPASSLKKTNPQKTSQLDRDQPRYKVTPGDGLCTDTVDVPTGPFRYYQVVADVVVPPGMVYPQKLKSEVAGSLELHMATNYKPHFILADGDSVNQKGKTKAMAQRHLVSLRASAPYRQWQNPA